VRKISAQGELDFGEDCFVCTRVEDHHPRGFSLPMLGIIERGGILDRQLRECRSSGKDAAAVANWHYSDLAQPKLTSSDAEATPMDTGRPTRGRKPASQAHTITTTKSPKPTKKKKKRGREDDENGEQPEESKMEPGSEKAIKE
jgi:hypothetical protein